MLSAEPADAPEALDLPVSEIFTAALANCYIYEVGAASRSREFSMETALPPIRTVTDSTGRVTDLDGCSSPAPADIDGDGRVGVPFGSASKRWGNSAGGLLRRYQSPQDDIKVFQISSTEEAREEDAVLH
jgi:hypothetical protein